MDTRVEKKRLIVVGVDGSESSRHALHWAVAQSKVMGGMLEVITTWAPPIPWGRTATLAPGQDQADGARKVLSEVVDSVLGPHSALDVQEVVVEGPAAPTLIAASKRADLLVVGSRGHGPFAGMLLGSVSRHCVTNAACPVVVVH